MEVVTHDDLGLAHDEEDIVWIPKVAAVEYIILTKDRNIRRNSVELQALIQSRAYFFALGRAERSAADNAKILLAHRGRIEEMVHERAPAVIAQVNQGEVLERLLDGTLTPYKLRGRSR